MSLERISPSLAPLAFATQREERRLASMRFKACFRLAPGSIVSVALVLPGTTSDLTGTRSRSRSCKASPPRNSRTKSLAGARRIEAGVPACTRAAVVHHRHVRRKPQGFVHVMRDENDRLAAAARECGKVRPATPRGPSGSSAAKGSSIRTMSGSPASARAMPMRCCWPPDNCLG